MIVISDNTATNLVLDRLTTDAVNDRLDALGLPKTRLRYVPDNPGLLLISKLSLLLTHGLGTSLP
jgi:beta-lactamase class A